MSATTYDDLPDDLDEITSTQPPSTSIGGNRKAYDALLKALEPYPSAKLAAIQWGAEAGKAPSDDIWEFVAGAFLAHSMGESAKSDSAEAALRAIRADIAAIALAPQRDFEDAIDAAATSAARITLAGSRSKVGGVTGRDLVTGSIGVTIGAAVFGLASHAKALAHATPETWLLSFILVVVGWFVVVVAARRSVPALADFIGGGLAIAVMAAATRVIYHR